MSTEEWLRMVELEARCKVIYDESTTLGLKDVLLNLAVFVVLVVMLGWPLMFLL